MGWLKFTTYHKRIFDFNHGGTKIHLVFIWRERFTGRPRIEVAWRTSKFKGVLFTFEVPLGPQGANWKQVFSKVRTSIAYGLNQDARAVTDRLMQVDKNKPHPIHKMTRTSKAI